MVAQPFGDGLPVVDRAKKSVEDVDWVTLPEGFVVELDHNIALLGGE